MNTFLPLVEINKCLESSFRIFRMTPNILFLYLQAFYLLSGLGILPKAAHISIKTHPGVSI